MDLHFLTDTFSDIYFLSITWGVILAGFIVLILLFLSGFASGSEIAIFSLTPKDLDQLDPHRNKKDQSIQLLRKDSERTLATILITNNLVNVMIIMLCNYIFGRSIHFGPKAYWLQFLILTVIVTFLLLLFGEIIPKVYCRQNPLNICRKTVKWLLTLQKIFYPMASMLIKSGFWAGKMFRKEEHSLSIDDLEQALELTSKEEIKEEKHILQGIIRFGDETVKEVMTIRQDFVDLDIKSPFNEVIACIVENNYSRIPVYQENRDHIKGVLYIKDVLPHLHKPESFRWQSLIRPAFFVPETKKIADLLKDFQEHKIHIAIVVDEFGGTCGLVTMEDILEEIVGEINDEYDDPEIGYSKVNYNTYIFEGKTLLTDFYKILNIDDEEFEEIEGDADSIGGLLLEIKGDFLSKDEIIDYKNYTFQVLNIDERRIDKVKITIN